MLDMEGAQEEGEEDLDFWDEGCMKRKLGLRLQELEPQEGDGEAEADLGWAVDTAADTRVPDPVCPRIFHGA